MLVHGYVRARGDGQLTVGCYLYDVALQDELVREGWVVPARPTGGARRTSAPTWSIRGLSGESPFFDSRIAYIAETGPKDHRIKRLAIMDSDGANHRFITTGQATALTPRYSPDYRKMLYLSYVDGNPRIYVYDIGTGKQTLVTQSTQSHLRAALVARWPVDPLFDGDRGQYRHLPRVGQWRPERAADQQRRASTSAARIRPMAARSCSKATGPGSQQIYVMDADGSNQRRISFFGGRARRPNGARAATRSPSPISPAISGSR